jgi:hypothetical protein
MKITVCSLVLQNCSKLRKVDFLISVIVRVKLF